jgi:hypothetical protein
MDQSRRNRGINAARETKNDFVILHFIPDLLAALFDKRAHGPIRPTAANPIEKVLQDFLSERGVGYFGMKLQSKKSPAGILHGGIRRVFSGAHGAESRRKRSYLISMTVPNLKFRRQTLEEIRLTDDLNAASSIFAAIGKFD